MATIATLVVDLIANTAQFAAGMQGSVQHVKGFNSAVMSMRGTFATVGDLARNSATLAEGFGASSEGANSLADGMSAVADSAMLASTNVDALQANVAKLGKLAKGPAGLAAIAATILAIFARYELFRDASIFDFQSKELENAPDTKVNRMVKAMEDRRKEMAKLMGPHNADVAPLAQHVRNLGQSVADAAANNVREKWKDLSKLGGNFAAAVELAATNVRDLVTREQELSAEKVRQGRADEIGLGIMQQMLALGKSDIEQARLKLMFMGLQGKQLDAAVLATGKIMEHERENARFQGLLSRAEAIKESQMSPVDSGLRDLEEILSLQAEGLLNPEQAFRAWMDSAMQGAKDAKSPDSPGALLYGTSKAFEAERSGTKPLENIGKQQLAKLGGIEKGLEKLNNAPQAKVFKIGGA